jgi:hypothetical protein
MSITVYSLWPLAATLPDHPALGESIIFQLNGLVVVFTALGLIWGLVEVMAFWFKRRARTVAASLPTPAPAAAVAPSVPGNEGMEPALVAAIAGAIHATLGAATRITSVVRVDAPDHGWSLEGRRQIHSARKVR